MSRIHKLPEEVLLIIFNKLNFYDIQQCQKVCPSWYHPAHVTLLQNVKLENTSDFKRFVNGINDNPDPFYLNAVQKITLGDMTRLGKVGGSINRIFKDFFRLILRFPNLKSVVFYGDSSPPVQLKKVNLDALLERCPKLVRFDVFGEMDDQDTYFNFLCMLQHTLRIMCITKIESVFLERYLDRGFSQLQTIRGWNRYLDNFENFLHLVENLPALKDITVGHESDGGTALEYLLSKPKDERDMIVERLSKFTRLATDQCITPFSVNVASFIMQYFTGLKTLELCSLDNTDWDGQKNKIFCKLLEYAINLKEFSASIPQLEMDGLSMCIEPIIQMTQSHQTNKRVQTYLVINLLEEDERGDCDIEIEMTQNRHTIKLALKICIYVSVAPQDIINLFEHVSSLNHIDIFAFGVDRIKERLLRFYSHYDRPFLTIVRRMTTLKELALDIPSVLDMDLDLGNISVTTLALRCDKDVLTGNAIKNYDSWFPGKLEHLQLFYFSGVWQRRIHRYHINLEFCSLEKLTVDLTPAKRRMKKWKKDAFIVVEVKCLRDNESRLFKTPTNLIGATEVNDASLEGLTIGKDYLVVCIMIKTLKCLDIFADRKGLYKYYDQRDSDELRYANLFNDKDVNIPLYKK